MALLEIHTRTGDYIKAGEALVEVLKMPKDEASEAWIERIKS